MNTGNVRKVLSISYRIKFLCVLMMILSVMSIILGVSDIFTYSGAIVLIGLVQPLFVGIAGAVILFKLKDTSMEHTVSMCALAVGVSTVLSDAILLIILNNPYLVSVIVADLIIALIVIVDSILYDNGYRHNAMRLSIMFGLELVIATLFLVVVGVLHLFEITEVPVGYYVYIAQIIMYVSLISIFVSPEMKDVLISSDLRKSISEISATLINDDSFQLTEDGLKVLKGEGMESWDRPGGDIECQKSFVLKGKGSNAVVTVCKWKGEDHLKGSIKYVMKRASSMGTGFDIIYVGQWEDYVRVYGKDGMFLQFYAGKDDYYTKINKKKI